MTRPAAIDVSLVGTDWWANASVIAAGVVAASIAAIAALLGYAYQKRATRQDQRAAVYATAIQAVEAYLEAPYRILRRDGSDSTRHELTRQISDIKSDIEYHRTLLRLHGSTRVADAYDSFAEAARADAGPAMTSAWHQAPTEADFEVPLGTALNRDRADIARVAVVDAMRFDLRRR